VKKIFTFAAIFAMSILAVRAQRFSCTAGEMTQKQYDKNPQLLVAKAQLDSFTAQFIQQGHAQQVQRGAGISYIIPVVFHILHAGGEENVSDSVIFVEMQHWNQYMGMTNPELDTTVPAFVNLVGNPQVEFRLAQIDPNGNCTNGIEHIYTQSTYFGDDNTKLDPWPREKYLNVWLEKAIQKDTTDYGILAYAYYPPAVATYTNNQIIDGIIAKNFVVGNSLPAQEFERPTLAHECGHWMNLEHTWGNTNYPDVACGDDGVNDTPLTEGDQNTDPITETRCTPGIIENVQNIMNYANMHFMYTQGQVDRMQAALNSPVSGRDSIWSTNNLIATGTNQPLTYPNPNSCASPIADFAVNNRFVCTGQNVVFEDVSYNAVYQTRQWTFPADGSITTSTDPSPVVQFSVPGWKQVTLMVSNANGSSQKVKAMVFVSAGAAVEAPYIETFEDTNEVDANWTVLNYDNNNTYFQWFNSGHYSNGSYKLNMYNGTYDGDKDELVSPLIDMSGLTNTQSTLSFEYSFGAFDATLLGDSIASLAVLASTDCGVTWKTIYYNTGGYNLFNAGGQTTGPYVPGVADEYWKTVNINLPYYLIGQQANFKIQMLSALGGNHFYVDNINVGQASALGINQVKASAISAINIAPNPAYDQTSIILSVSTAANITMSLYDMMGREVAPIYQGQVDQGQKSIEFNSQDIATGIYLVKVYDGNTTIQKRFVKL
jgi:PKD repeat protein